MCITDGLTSCECKKEICHQLSVSCDQQEVINKTHQDLWNHITENQVVLGVM